jgi:hypothetical protein
VVWTEGTNHVTKGIAHTFSNLPANTNIFLKVEVVNTDFHNPKTQYVKHVGVGLNGNDVYTVTDFCYPPPFLQAKSNTYFVCVENIDVTPYITSSTNNTYSLQVFVSSTYEVSFGTFSGYLLYSRLTLSGIKTPTSQPTSQPTGQPSRQPTAQPTRQPTGQPSRQPSRQPTSQPTRQPFGRPTSQPTVNPTIQPSSHPSSLPTSCPSTSTPTGTPSFINETVGVIRWTGKQLNASWHDPWNWDKHIVPTVSHAVVIDLLPGEAVTLSRSVVVNSLKLSGNGGVLYLTDTNVHLNITDEFHFESGIIEGFCNETNANPLYSKPLDPSDLAVTVKAVVVARKLALLDSDNKKFMRYIRFVIEEAMEWRGGELVLASTVIDVVGVAAVVTVDNNSSGSENGSPISLRSDVSHDRFDLFLRAQLNLWADINRTLPRETAVNDMIITR